MYGQTTRYDPSLRYQKKEPVSRFLLGWYCLVIYFCTTVPFLTASAKAKMLSDFMMASPCLSSPSTTN